MMYINGPTVFEIKQNQLENISKEYKSEKSEIRNQGLNGEHQSALLY